MGRSPCCTKEGLNRGAWTVLEDKILTDYIKVHGEGRWRNLPKKAGLKRCGKSCRLRWLNYLRPDIKRGNITHDEEELIIRLHKLLGNRWSLIAGRLPGRTDNEIKNYWNTKIGKKMQENQSSAGTANHKSDGKNKKKSGGGGGSYEEEPPSTNAAAPPPTPKMQPHVFHTKAMRCTKAFINPQAYKVEHVNSTTNHLQAGPPSSMVRDRSIDQPADYHYDSNNNGISSFTSGDVDNADFMMDFSMGELSLADLLNSNFSADLCNFNYSNDNSNDLSPSSTDQPLMFTGEMLEDWALKDGTAHQPNVNYFSSFLDSEGDWLRE